MSSQLHLVRLPSLTLLFDMSSSTSNFVAKLLPIIERHHTSDIPFPEYFSALKQLSMKRYAVTYRPYTCKFEGKETGDVYTDVFPPNDVSEEDMMTAEKGQWHGNELFK